MSVIQEENYQNNNQQQNNNKILQLQNTHQIHDLQKQIKSLSNEIILKKHETELYKDKCKELENSNKNMSLQMQLMQEKLRLYENESDIKAQSLQEKIKGLEVINKDLFSNLQYYENVIAQLEKDLSNEKNFLDENNKQIYLDKQQRMETIDQLQQNFNQQIAEQEKINKKKQLKYKLKIQEQQEKIEGYSQFTESIKQELQKHSQEYEKLQDSLQKKDTELKETQEIMNSLKENFNLLEQQYRKIVEEWKQKHDNLHAEYQHNLILNAQQLQNQQNQIQQLQQTHQQQLLQYTNDHLQSKLYQNQNTDNSEIYQLMDQNEKLKQQIEQLHHQILEKKQNELNFLTNQIDIQITSEQLIELIDTKGKNNINFDNQHLQDLKDKILLLLQSKKQLKKAKKQIMNQNEQLSEQITNLEFQIQENEKLFQQQLKFQQDNFMENNNIQINKRQNSNFQPQQQNNNHNMINFQSERSSVDKRLTMQEHVIQNNNNNNINQQQFSMEMNLKVYDFEIKNLISFVYLLVKIGKFFQKKLEIQESKLKLFNQFSQYYFMSQKMINDHKQIYHKSHQFLQKQQSGQKFRQLSYAIIAILRLKKSLKNKSKSYKNNKKIFNIDSQKSNLIKTIQRFENLNNDEELFEQIKHILIDEKKSFLDILELQKSLDLKEMDYNQELKQKQSTTTPTFNVFNYSNQIDVQLDQDKFEKILKLMDGNQNKSFFKQRPSSNVFYNNGMIIGLKNVEQALKSTQLQFQSQDQKIEKYKSDKIQEQLKSVEREKKLIESENLEFKNIISENLELIEQLQNSIQNKEKEIEQINKNFQELDRYCEDLNREIQQLKEENDSLNQYYLEQEQQIKKKKFNQQNVQINRNLIDFDNQNLEIQNNSHSENQQSLQKYSFLEDLEENNDNYVQNSQNKNN